MLSADSRASFCAILSGFLYGFLGYFGMSVVNANISISNMLFWRFLISGVFCFLFILPKIRKIQDSWRDLFLAFANGALFYAISTTLYFHASEYIGTGLAMVIFFTFPAMIMMFNYFVYGQKISAIYYIAIIIILFGMSLFVDLNEITMDLTGIVIGLVCALFYAGYIIWGKKCKISPIMSTMMVSFGCAFSSLIFTILGQSFVVPDSITVWSNLLGIGVLSTALPVVLLFYSLKHLGSVKASILSVLEPVFVVIFGVILLGEQMTIQHALGVVIVLTGALITLFSHMIRLDKLQQLFSFCKATTK